tara:strand:- start:1226 stop:1921 length:696 start_codon:yes stop_codon:yes gene_type:complete
MNALGMSVLKSGWKWVNNRLTKETSSNQVLEPFSTLLKLAIISYKNDGTKIAIYKNKLYIQEPGLTQGTSRYMYGNSREEIHHLLKPLMRCINLYPIDDNPELKQIYNQAIEGLKKLKESYNNESSTVCCTIDLYIQILNNAVEENSVHVDSFEKSQNLDDLSLSTNTKLNLEKIFEGIWSSNDINLVSSMFILVNTTNECKDSYLKGIENVIKAKETVIETKINRATQLV